MAQVGGYIFFFALHPVYESQIAYSTLMGFHPHQTPLESWFGFGVCQPLYVLWLSQIIHHSQSPSCRSLRTGSRISSLEYLRFR